MKETTRTSRTAGYLEKIFRALNADLFDGVLEEPIITIQSTPKAYGHVTVAKAWAVKDERRHELNLGAETLKRPIEEVVATIVHEMVHLYNIQNGVQDCSRGGMYHNKRFKEEAERRLLHIEHHDKYGWTITSPTEALVEYILTKEWNEVLINRGFEWTPTGAGGSKTGAPSGGVPGFVGKRPSSTRKYQCPCCKNSVRATKAVRISCMDCDMQMVVVG